MLRGNVGLTPGRLRELNFSLGFFPGLFGVYSGSIMGGF